MSWLSRLLRREKLERDLERELQFHVDAQADDLMRSGLSREGATRESRLLLGGVEQVKEAARDARGTRWIDDWWRDTRHALRGMVRSPGFSGAAILTIALGIGANTAVWSIMEALMLRSLPVDRPSELYAIKKVGVEDESYLISHPLMLRLRSVLPDSAHLAAMSAFTRMYATIRDLPEGVVGQLVSGNWFSLLGTRAAAGRLISPTDDRTLGGHPVVVLSESFWRRRFGGDPAVIGSTLRVNGASLTVIGVAEARFSGLTVGQSTDVWIPLMMQHEVRYKGSAISTNSDTERPWAPQEGVKWLTLVVRVPPGSSDAFTARLELPFHSALVDQFAQQDSAERARGLREHVALEPIQRGFSPLRQYYRGPLSALLVGVALVLFIACGNLAGLLLARSAAHTHEVAIRVSLGARPGRLVRQVLTESLTLAAFGGALSLFVARWGSAALLRLASTGTRAIPLDVGMDARVVGFALGATLITGILFGLAPALRVARTDLYTSFKTGGRVAGGSAHRLPLGRALVAAQVAFSLILVTSAGVFVRTFRNFLQIDPGYPKERIVTARLDVRAAGYAYEQLPALHERLLDAVRAIPGVRSASLSLNGLAGGSRRVSSFIVPGRTLTPGENGAQENYVTPDYFAATGMALLRGRSFAAADRQDAPRVVIVSEALAKQFFGTDDVLGARFGYGTPPNLEIVGVVRDSRVNSLKEAPDRLVFYPLAQGPQEYVTSLEVRSATQATSVAAIRAAIAGVDRNLPVRDVATVSELFERQLGRERLLSRLAGAFGFIALLLAAIGLYGVVGYSVARRTNEMGVRIALGASPAGVGWVVLRDSLITIALGLAAGFVLWFPVLGLTEKLVFGLSPHDPLTLAFGMGLLLVVGVAAAAIPAWRAGRIDPMSAIRAE
jgi:predicted permease